MLLFSDDGNNPDYDGIYEESPLLSSSSIEDYPVSTIGFLFMGAGDGWTAGEGGGDPAGWNITGL